MQIADPTTGKISVFADQSPGFVTVTLFDGETHLLFALTDASAALAVADMFAEASHRLEEMRVNA